MITIKDIIVVVASEYRMSPEHLMERTRRPAVARPRQLVMWIAREFTKLSLPAIGERMGGFDHTTIMYGIKRMQAFMALDPTLEPKARQLAALAAKRAAARVHNQSTFVPVIEPVAASA